MSPAQARRSAGGDDLDLDPGIESQPGHADGRSRRRVGWEELAVDLVHRGEVVELAQVDGRLHDVAVVEPDGAEHSPDVLQHLPCLGPDPARDRAGGAWLVADLAREEHEAAGLDGLAERQARRRNPGTAEDTLRHDGASSRYG